MEASGGNLKVWMAVFNYSLCSAGLLLLNKLSMYYIPLPSLVSTCQLVFCTVFVWILKFGSSVEIDDLVWEKVKPYSIYTIAFCASIYSNMRALAGSNVDTVIVFRSCAPLVVSLLDWIFMGRAFPSIRSFGALLLILLGAIGYVASDSEFYISGWGAYTWCMVYLSLICFVMCFGKQIVSNVQMKNMMGHVYYTNVLSILPMIANGLFVAEEQMRLDQASFNTISIIFLFLSCIIGIAISYTGWYCRDLLSATSYTLVGVLNKLIPVLINAIMWDKHATALGIFFLCVCISGGGLYTQSPMRAEALGPERIVVTGHRNASDSADKG
eukprot:NODE_2493_length_1162_cov_40.947826_g2376_i0.p1 GENE.NODE_2493_length_1162_cov_40.947826_g2376_i0~~NODE_2493_length_1162_cov_40.947826_g2376_i0.p1  ORF type:complete len:327 (+),score=66.21 NODE_2493_length_1162_cov_40.947826_g2376_i0:66-1046(+)